MPAPGPERLIQLFTCAWGDWHVEMLGRVMWPTILAPGNLPALARQHDLHYSICTTPADRARLEAMPSFAAIAALARVDFDTALLGPTPQIADHMRWYWQVQDQARAQGCPYLWLWPDVIFSATTLGHAGEALARGKAGAAIPTLRVVAETCVPDFLARFAGAPGDAIALASGDAVRLLVRHLHPLSAANLERGRHGKPNTSMLFRVPGEGLIARSAYTWLFLDPTRLVFTPEGDVVSTAPEDPGSLVHIGADSDDMLFLSLAPLGKEIETFVPDHATDALGIARLTLHPSLAASPFYDCFDRVATRLHYGAMTEARWAVVERRSDRVFDGIVALRRLLRVHARLAELGCGDAARLFSLALHTTALARLLPRDAGHTIVIPTDAALAPALEPLARRGARRRLLRALLDHVIAGHADLPETGVTRLSAVTGKPLAVDRAAVVAQTTIAGYRLWIVDRRPEAAP